MLKDGQEQAGTRRQQQYRHKLLMQLLAVHYLLYTCKQQHTHTRTTTRTIKMDGMEGDADATTTTTTITTPEPTDGPDQVLPADRLKTWEADGCVRLVLSAEGPCSEKPVSVHTMMREKAEAYPNHPALAVKREGAWQYWTYKQYFDDSKKVAKAYIRLGLERYHGVCIMGFNSPEWVIASNGAVFAGGFSVGVYTTNSPEACRYQADDCRAQIVVVENKEALDKFLAVKRFLPDIKAIVQWSGVPGAPGVLSWPELLAVGAAEKDTQLQHRLSLAAVNQCCTLIYTSGTTGPPKGVMCSQDHLTWVAKMFEKMVTLEPCTDCVVSYLPLSHLAAHMLDIYVAANSAATVYFAQPDALKGTLLQTLLEVQPTSFLAVPRVWEKMYEKMQEAGAKVGGIKRSVASWAKHHCLNYYKALQEGRPLTTYETVAYPLAKKLIINRVKEAIGLGRCKHMVSGTAPISKDVLEYFLSLDLPIMEGYGLSESMSIASLCFIAPFMFREKSVGKVLEYTTVRLKEVEGRKPEEGELCFKGRNIFMGYLGMPDKTNETIDDEGWMHTGDIGSFDRDGFLYITGRIKELVITAGGENIPPVLIENVVKKEVPVLSNAVLIGDKRKYLSMLLTLKAETDLDTGEPLDVLTPPVLEVMKDIGLEDIHTTRQAVDEVHANPQGALASLIQGGISRYNEDHSFSNAQKVQRWTLLPLDFSLPTGELNNTLKLKRNVVMEKYRPEIDAMYDTPAADPIGAKSKL
ncbi:hypothetical protein Pmani_035839 [Petrolisthes manimaculis]|uniref:long-chain-fatty-acid--CoA ligase n=1 Tax=Petrolisthes manimaculis TaxID=1843537 RepID=A0AAE1NJP6_9EUCA|nr:hypothetical protein Pmani_035839 [Petrolisthes manimaculis]